MNTQIRSLSRTIAALGFTLGTVSLLSGTFLSFFFIPASAAGDVERLSISGPSIQDPAACFPHEDWGHTVPLAAKETIEWTFQVKKPESFIGLRFYYYQDYDPNGCPVDCSTGLCETGETGVGESPYGSFEITDGKEIPIAGFVKQEGFLPEGTYSVKFRSNGDDPINVGLVVRKRDSPTDTPEPPPTNTPAPTDVPATPTATEVPATPTATLPGAILPPLPSPTNTLQPTVTSETPPTVTPTGNVQPPGPGADQPTPTATATDKSQPPGRRRTPTPPPTLAPPSAPTGGTQPAALIPNTGAELVVLDVRSGLPYQVLLKLGVGLLGLALILHGISKKIK
jgi:hypothetical protein